MSGPRVVLAYSGGLDTSYCVLALREAGFRVHAAFVDTGGVEPERIEEIRERALALGAEAFHQLDGGEALWRDFVVPLARAGGKVLDAYPMLCSDRYVIAEMCLELCRKLGTDHFAHGCTGMGNDQVRFDQSVRSLGDFKIYAPIRDLQRTTREVRAYELKALTDAGCPFPEETARYSINENLLGVTLSGGEVDRFQAPGPETRAWCRPREEWPADPLKVTIGFRSGQAVSLDGRELPGPELLTRLNRSFATYGVGRHVYTGDVTVGLKGRIVFECPGIEALMTAQRALEDGVNTRHQNGFRHIVAGRWADLVYSGFFFEPHKSDLDAYLASAHRWVTGEVDLWSPGGRLDAVAVRSPYVLTDPESVYAQSASWTPEEAEGFVKLLGWSSTTATRIRGRPTRSGPMVSASPEGPVPAGDENP